MPELPDVEIFKRYLNATALHKEIGGVEVSAPELLEGVSVQRLRGRLVGRRLTASRRHGKHLFVRVDGGEDGWLRLHFGMTGRLEYSKDAGKIPEHTRLRLDFTNGYHLAYDNPRKLGEIGWVKSVEGFLAEKGLGPDPLADDLPLEAFRRLLAGRRGMVKTTLMNQEVLAGLGNVYADEMLFQAGVHPETKIPHLENDAFEGLYHALYQVIEGAIEAKADPANLPDDWLLPHRGEAGACPRCGGMLKNVDVGGRTTWYCARHQKRS